MSEVQTMLCGSTANENAFKVYPFMILKHLGTDNYKDGVLGIFFLS